ncbi:MAG TPA: hypothetical protein VIY48_04760 [Candidatus Paceibacterota bacterium]
MGLIGGGSNTMGEGTRNRLIEYTQALIAGSFTLVTCYLIVAGAPIPSEFWTLNVGIVSFYFTKQASTIPTSKETTA